MDRGSGRSKRGMWASSGHWAEGGRGGGWEKGQDPKPAGSPFSLRRLGHHSFKEASLDRLVISCQPH